MKSFFQYLAESVREYDYRLRTIVPITPESIDVILQVLEKYNPITVSKPMKTILQDSPLDFPNVTMAEVYILDIKTSVPLSPTVFLQEVRGALNIPESDLVIRNLDDPVEIETVIRDSNDGVKDSEENPLLSTSPAYHEYDTGIDEPQAFGDDYNKRFLAYLAKVASEREEIKDEIQPENQKKQAFGIFSELSKNSENFNKEFDAPKPIPANKARSSSPLPLSDVRPEGNFSTYKRTVKNLKGE